MERDGEDVLVRACVGVAGTDADADAGRSMLQAGGKRELRVDAKRAGMRLDAVLGELFPGMGVRGRRRLVERGNVLLNGCHAKPGQTVRAGDRVETAGGPSDQPVQTGELEGVPQARLLGVRGDFCFFAKPAMLHTVRVAGSSEPSLEDQVPGILAAYRRDAVERSAQYVHPPVRLLQRLDFETSGIVAGALSAEAEVSFREHERDGRVQKCYVCLLEGNLKDEVVVASRLVSGGHGKVRVLDEDDSDSARQTLLCPLCRLDPADKRIGVQGVDSLTLAGAVIGRGTRHQIRAHVASLGHPLVGDFLYGAKGCFTLEENEVSPCFLLHHCRINFESVCVELEPQWNLSLEKIEYMRCWLREI